MLDLSLMIEKSTNIIILRNPVGTAMGILSGFFTYGISTKVFLYEKLDEIYYIVGGVLLLNFPNFISKRNSINHELLEQFDTVDFAQKQRKISNTEAQLLYKSIMRNYVAKKLNNSPSKIQASIRSDAPLS